MFQATSKYTILRGDATDQYGDPTGQGTPVHTHKIGSVMENTRRVYNPNNGRIDTVRTLTGRFRNGTDVVDGDQIKDERTDKIYIVSSVHNNDNSPVNKPDVVLDLTRNVGGA